MGWSLTEPPNSGSAAPVTSYITTDLDLFAPYDLTPLAEVLEGLGFWAMQTGQRDEGDWSARLGQVIDNADPEATISAMLEAIETLHGEAKALWSGCSLREFDLGFDCGASPFCFHSGLTHATLSRVASVGAGLRITLYAPEAILPAEQPGETEDGNVEAVREE